MKSRISKSRFTFLFLAPSLMTTGWIIAVLMEPPPIVAIFGFIIVALAWYGYLTIPFEFELTADTIRFSSVLQKITVQVSDVHEIDARPWNRGMVIFYLPQTTISLFRSMPELNKLIETVKHGNHGVRLRGKL